MAVQYAIKSEANICHKILKPMKLLKNLTLVVLLTACSLMAIGQEKWIEELVQEGIDFHDQGEYAKAIVLYKKALELDSTSSLANYELSYSLLASGEYNLAVEYARKVIEQDGDHMLPAYICLGNALDLQGNPDQAIECYEQALESFDHYLIHYNLALTCYNSGDNEKAFQSILNAINSNPVHGSSHLALSKIMEEEGSRVRAMLPLYFFLLIEPDSQRAAIEYDRLKGFMEQGVSRTSDTEINVNVPEESDSDFGAAEMILSMSRASYFTEESKGKSELESFAETNESLFGVLSELKKDNTGFFWDFYVPYFSELNKEKHTEAYSYYISLSQGEQAITWIDSNDRKMNKFIDWVNE